MALAEESSPFLEKEQDSLSRSQELNKDRMRLSRYAYTIFHLIAFLLYTCIFCVIFIVVIGNGAIKKTLYSPAQGVIEYELRPLDGLIGGNNEFTKPPGAVSDAAWGKLLEGINLEITPHEMRELGGTSISVRNGSGFLGTLSVNNFASGFIEITTTGIKVKKKLRNVLYTRTIAWNIFASLPCVMATSLSILSVG
ncbi:hypothetical protein HJFPF1_05578 [Paramyrothecium foliicola]|nr:hypothetical protein HJFPF1_05578 [Paramyrothecium foliicola]